MEGVGAYKELTFSSFWDNVRLGIILLCNYDPGWGYNNCNSGYEAQNELDSRVEVILIPWEAVY